MRLADLQKNERKLEVEFAGETLHITYRPAEVTPAFWDEFSEAKKPAVWALSKVGVSWDLLDDNAQPLALTEQELIKLPTPFLRTVLQAILEDVNVGEAFGVTSKSG